MTQLGPHWREILVVAGLAVLALGGIAAWWRRPARDPAEIEQKRRSYVNKIGRIVEGRLFEVVDVPAEAAPQRRGFFRKRAVAADNGSRKLLYYSYSISGVTYETAQDITGLEVRASLVRLVDGQAASVKYDPANPSNSILIADDWSGLH